MQQKCVASGLLLSYLAIVVATPFELKQSIIGTMNPKTIKLVASVEGKSFFAEDAPKRTRDEADNYCKSMGLKLASIASMAQYDALKLAYLNGFEGEYWTSAKDVSDLRQVAWEETNGQPDFSMTFGGANNRCQRGLTYEQTPTRIGYLWLNPFTKEVGALCQT